MKLPGCPNGRSEAGGHPNTELTRGLDPLVPNLRVERLPNASHWVMADAPERVTRLLIQFLRAE